MRHGSLGVLALLACALLSGATLSACAHKPRVRPLSTIGDLSARPPTMPIQTGQLPPAQPGKAMDNYRQFLELQNSDPKLRAEALRRLGDLNLESGELQRLADEVIRVDAQSAQAIQLYSTLLKAYPNYPRNDEVLYQLARAYDTTAQSALALANFDAIVQRYPDSHIIGEVQFRRGELLFSAQRYPEAQRAYEAVLARGPQASSFYQQSLYKHAWSQFKQGENPESLQSFADLLDFTLIDRQHAQRARALEGLGRADRELVEDTLRVMSISFSYLDGAKSVDELIARRAAAPPYAWLLYARLGDLYVQKQRYQDAAATYRAFVARDPADEHAPTLSMAAIEAYRKGGFPALMLDGKLEYVQRYAFGMPFWQGRARGDYAQVVAELKTNLRDVAEYYHAQAQKSKGAEDYSAAARWYRVYLSSFPGEPDSAATNYRLADALFESKQYLPAATEYEHTAYDYPKHALAAEAGYAALVCYQKYEDSLAPEQRAAVHPHEIDSALKFAQTFPERPESPVVLTRAAQDLYAAGDQTRALSSARLLLGRASGVTAAQQRIGWSIVGQVEFNHADYGEAEAAFTHALALTASGDPERSGTTERLAASVYKQAEGKRQAGDQLAAADAFLRVARLAPSSSIAQTARYDGATALINAQQWARAIDVLQAYRRDYPNGQYRADVAQKLAVAYTAAGQSAAAASEFERIAADPSQTPALVHEALGKAADLYQQSGNLSRAVVLLEREVTDYPTPVADAIELRQRLADIATQSGQLERAHYWQREIVRADAGAGAARTDRTRYLAARSQLALTEPLRDEFRNVKLVAPLKRSLQAKQHALDAAVQAYQQVATYDVAETTTAATYETAELYRTLARDLLASERPKKLSADELEQYQSLLEDQAYPFEEKSIAIHQLNAQRIPRGVYDESVRKSMTALAELMPARYGKIERSESWVAVIAAPAPAVAATAPAAAPAAAASGAIRLPALSSPASPTPPPPSARASVPPPTAEIVHDFQHITDLANAGKDTDALLELQQFQLRHPGYAAPAINAALLYRRTGHFGQAEVSLQQATALDPSNAVAWDELGVTLREEGKFSPARVAYGRAIESDPNYAPPHRNLGVLLDLYFADAGSALPEFERYKALSGEDKPVSSWIADVRQRSTPHAADAQSVKSGGNGANNGAISGDHAAKSPNDPTATQAPNSHPAPAAPAAAASAGNGGPT